MLFPLTLASLAFKATTFKRPKRGSSSDAFFDTTELEEALIWRKRWLSSIDETFLQRRRNFFNTFATKELLEITSPSFVLVGIDDKKSKRFSFLTLALRS